MTKELILAVEEEVGDGLVTGSLTFDGEYYVSMVVVMFNDLVTHRTGYAVKYEDLARNRFEGDVASALTMAKSTAFLISLAVNQAARVARAEGRAEVEMGVA